MQRALFEPKPSSLGDALARLWQYGALALTDTELVALLLEPSSPDAEQAAQRALGPRGLSSLCRIRPRALLSQHGLTVSQAVAVLAAVELGRRMARLRVVRGPFLERPDLLAGYLWMKHQEPDQEIGGAVYLDARHRLIEDQVLYRGTASRLPIEPRVVLRVGLECGASALVFFHTHPSGDPAPSREDLLLTRRLQKAGEVVGITVLDHLILGSCHRFVSLRRRGEGKL